MSRNRLRSIISKEINNSIEKYEAKSSSKLSTPQLVSRPTTLKKPPPPQIQKKKEPEPSSDEDDDHSSSSDEYSGYEDRNEKRNDEKKRVDERRVSSSIEKKRVDDRSEKKKVDERRVSSSIEKKKRVVLDNYPSKIDDEKKVDEEKVKKEKKMREDEERKMREEDEKKMRDEEEKKRREEEEKKMREEEERMREQEKMREEEERMRQEKMREEEEKKMREQEKMREEEEKKEMKKELDEEKRSIVKNDERKSSRRREESDDDEKRDSGSEGEDEDLKMAYNPFDNFPRTSFLKLIKNSGAESIATPVVDTIRDISLDFLNYMFDMLTEMKSQIESSDVKHFIELFVEDFNELPETVVLSSSIFERCILEICNQRKIKIKRDAVTTTHELLELVLQKVIKGAVLIADNSRRRRVTEREIEIAYEIYMS